MPNNMSFRSALPPSPHRKRQIPVSTHNQPPLNTKSASTIAQCDITMMGLKNDKKRNEEEEKTAALQKNEEHLRCMIIKERKNREREN
jgi:hypothetical protein